MATTSDGRCSATRRLVPVALLSGALVHELLIDSSEDSLLPLAKSRIGLGRLRHRHNWLSVQLTTRGIAEVPSKGVRSEPEDSLQLSNPHRLRCRLAGEPLRNRGLGDAQCGGKLALGQAALDTSAPECASEVLPLIGRRHVIVLSRPEPREQDA
jgi:hypothetical protein